MGLFDDNNDDKTTSTGCPVPKDVDSLTVTGSGHRAMYIICGACAAFTFVSSVLLILLHLTRYRAPKEQRQIVRIVFMPFVFAIVCWAELKNYKIAAYIDPIGEVYESWAICAIFLLYIQFAAPNSTFGEDMFLAVSDAAEIESKKANWPKLSWVLVFQYPITEIIAVIVLEATEAAGTYCLSSLKPKYGHLWVQIIRLVGVGLAAITVIRFYSRMKVLMKARRGAIKLFSFKGFIFLGVIQSWVFSILINRNVIHTSSTYSYGDLLYGIPNTLRAVEAVILSALNWYAFSAAEYGSKIHRGKAYNFFHAMANSLNPTDLLLGIARAVQLLLGMSGESSSRGYYGDVDAQYKFSGEAYGAPPPPPPPHYGDCNYQDGYGRA